MQGAAATDARSCDKLAAVEPTVPNYFVPSLVSFALRQGVAPEPLFTRIGHSLETARRAGTMFSLREVEQLFEALAAETGSPAIALSFGKEIDPERLGLFGLLVSTASTPRAAIACLSEFKALLHPQLDIGVEEREGRTYVRYVSSDSSPLNDKSYYAEALLSASHHLSSLLWRRPLAPLYAAFRHRAPGHVRAYEQTFRCALRFNQSCDELCYDFLFLDLPWHGASKSHQAVRAQAKQALASGRSASIAQVERVIALRLADPELSLRHVAKALAVSSRSLQRSLAQAGTTFRVLRDSVRYRRSRELLADASLTTDALATALGYRDRSNFVRAFVRWSGQSPSDYRQGAGGAI
ncbi:MAG: hypothetical protein JWN04_5713 [Myxococcaceae bacterium]|nr:hypothetical protein [Myxococcaceae bacterium]